jgi:hypothetical protein
MSSFKLTLNNPMWNTQERRKVLGQVVQESGSELEGEIKKTITDSTPAGRLYRKGSITKAATKPLLALGLKTRKGNANRVVAGSRIHRASRKGQPPAVDTGGLIGSIRAKKTGEMKSTVTAGKAYAEPLDDPKELDRPFFRSTAEKFRPKFKENIEDAIKSGK